MSRKIEGDEDTLPYVGQVGLCELGQDGVILIDSEDLQSAFNLFEMPLGWRGFFVYRSPVSGHLLGLATDEPTWVALRPDGDLYLLYLDSVDQLRPVSKAMLSVCEGRASPEHQRFEATCQRFGLPTNASKRLAGALQGSLQGGELLGDVGVFMLHPDKMRFTIAACLSLLASPKWERRAVAGLVGRLVFGAAFRRPLMATFQDVFRYMGSGAGAVTPGDAAVDEVLVNLALLPLAFTNLRAALHQKMYCTDASPTGAGACVAELFKRPFGCSSPLDVICVECRRDLTEDTARGTDMDCPLRCGRKVCSLDCFSMHRRCCPWRDQGVPRFSERFSGGEARLSKAMCQEGFDALAPFDWARSYEMDVFSQDGKRLVGLPGFEGPSHRAPRSPLPHHVSSPGAPHLFRRPPASGAHNPQGRASCHGCGPCRCPPPIWHRFGKPTRWRCAQFATTRGVSFPWSIPEIAGLVDLARSHGVYLAIFSHCCYAGSVDKPANQQLQSLRGPPLPPWPKGRPASVYTGTTKFVVPSEEEPPYPEQLCLTYAQTARNMLSLPSYVGAVMKGIRHRCTAPCPIFTRWRPPWFPVSKRPVSRRCCASAITEVLTFASPSKCTGSAWSTLTLPIAGFGRR